MNPPSCKPVSEFMQSIDLVRRYMETFKYCIHDGSVFKKVRESKFTYVYFSPVKQFLMFPLYTFFYKNNFIRTMRLRFTKK